MEFFAYRLNRNVFKRGVRRSTRVQVIADGPDVDADYTLLDLEDEGLGVVEGRIDLPAGTEHLPANPANIDAEIGPLAQEQIMRIQECGCEVVGGGAGCYE